MLRVRVGSTAPIPSSRAWPSFSRDRFAYNSNSFQILGRPKSLHLVQRPYRASSVQRLLQSRHQCREPDGSRDAFTPKNLLLTRSNLKWTIECESCPGDGVGSGCTFQNTHHLANSNLEYATVVGEGIILELYSGVSLLSIISLYKSTETALGVGEFRTELSPLTSQAKSSLKSLLFPLTLARYGIQVLSPQNTRANGWRNIMGRYANSSRWQS